MRRSNGPSYIMLIIITLGLLGYRTYKMHPWWRPYTSEAGGFSVSLPGPPVEKLMSTPSYHSNVALHVVEVSRGEMTYVISYADHPLNPNGVTTDTSLLSDTVDSIERERPLLTRIAISSGIFSGIEVYYVGKHNLGVRIRIYQVHNRVYRIVFAAPRGFSGQSNGVKFMNSFKLTPNAPTPAT